jgi:hypothetical protein
VGNAQEQGANRTDSGAGAHAGAGAEAIEAAADDRAEHVHRGQVSADGAGHGGVAAGVIVHGERCDRHRADHRRLGSRERPDGAATRQSRRAPMR